MFKIDRWPNWLRYTGYFLCFSGIWAIFSLGHLMANEPEAFQAAGSIVVAFAVFTLARSRVSYESALRRSQEIFIAAYLKKLDEQRKINEQRTENTFRMHALQIAQMSMHLNVPSIVGPSNAEELRREEEELQQLFANGSHFPPIEAVSELGKAQTQLETNVSNLEPWANFIWKLEVFFIILGTLQWGYGNFWVTFIHEQVIPTFS